MSRAPYLGLFVALAACGADNTPAGEPLGGSLMVVGDVHDFQSGAALDVTATVSTTALIPAPTISVTGAHFTIDGVPENSSFQILAAAAPTHHSTYSPAIDVTSDDVDNAVAYAVSEQYLGTLASGFGVTPSAGKGIVLLHLVDGQGNPKTGVAAGNFVLVNTVGANGPKFLDAQLAPAPNATASTASGWAVFFEVPPGVISLGAAAAATATLAMPTSPVAGGAVTVATVVVTDGAPAALPTNVSFANQVFPIFTKRGCVACHTGSGPGKDLGGLMLDGGSNLAYKELAGTEDPMRVQRTMPEKSLVLTMPSAESPADAHPNVTFTGPQDADYLKILVWIREGAKDN